MGFKGAADKVSYINRTGEHSTKPRKTGSNTDLAEDGMQIEYAMERAVSAREVVLEIDCKLGKVLNEMGSLDETLNSLSLELLDTLRAHNYREKQRLKMQLGHRKQELQREISRLKLQRKQLAISFDVTKQENFEQVFIDLARDILPKDVFNKIYEGARIISKNINKAKP